MTFKEIEKEHQKAQLRLNRILRKIQSNPVLTRRSRAVQEMLASKVFDSGKSEEHAIALLEIEALQVALKRAMRCLGKYQDVQLDEPDRELVEAYCGVGAWEAKYEDLNEPNMEADMN